MAVLAKFKELSGIRSDVDMYIRIDELHILHGSNDGSLHLGAYVDEASAKEDIGTELEPDVVPTMSNRIAVKVFPLNRAQAIAILSMTRAQIYAYLKSVDADLNAGSDV